MMPESEKTEICHNLHNFMKVLVTKRIYPEAIDF